MAATGKPHAGQNVELNMAVGIAAASHVARLLQPAICLPVCKLVWEMGQTVCTSISAQHPR